MTLHPSPLPHGEREPDRTAPSSQPFPSRGGGAGPDGPHPNPPARGREHDALRRAVVYGSVAASFTVEAFGVERLAAVTREDVEARYAEFKELVAF